MVIQMFAFPGSLLHKFAHTHTYAHTHMHTQTCTHTYTVLYTHACTHTHTIHTHTHYSVGWYCIFHNVGILSRFSNI